jgi:hypothetical protein
LDVGQRNRLPCWPGCQGDATTEVEACAVTPAGVARNWRWSCTQHVEEGQRSGYARAVSVPWRGRERGNVRYLLPAAALRGAPDCLDSPVYEPYAEHARAQVPNAKERMDPAWRMQVATVLMANAARNRSSEIRSAACLEKSQKSETGVDFARPIRKAR